MMMCTMPRTSLAASRVSSMVIYESIPTPHFRQGDKGVRAWTAQIHRSRRHAVAGAASVASAGKRGQENEDQTHRCTDRQRFKQNHSASLWLRFGLICER